MAPSIMKEGRKRTVSMYGSGSPSKLVPKPPVTGRKVNSYMGLHNRTSRTDSERCRLLRGDQGTRLRGGGPEARTARLSVCPLAAQIHSTPAVRRVRLPDSLFLFGLLQYFGNLTTLPGYYGSSTAPPRSLTTSSSGVGYSRRPPPPTHQPHLCPAPSLISLHRRQEGGSMIMAALIQG